MSISYKLTKDTITGTASPFVHKTENGAIISSPTYKEKTSQAPHGSAGKPVTKFIKINKL